MSSKRKADRPRSKTEEKQPKVPTKVARPPGRVPTATVIARHGGVMVARSGRGFSARELSGAQFPWLLARAWGVPVDDRRRSLLEANLQSLKKWYSPPAPEPVNQAQPEVAAHKTAKPSAKAPRKRTTRKKKAED